MLHFLLSVLKKFWCSGVFRDVPGVFRGVPGCTGLFLVLQTPVRDMRSSSFFVTFEEFTSVNFPASIPSQSAFTSHWPLLLLAGPVFTPTCANDPSCFW